MNYWERGNLLFVDIYCFVLLHVTFWPMKRIESQFLPSSMHNMFFDLCALDWSVFRFGIGTVETCYAECSLLRPYSIREPSSLGHFLKHWLASGTLHNYCTCEWMLGKGPGAFADFDLCALTTLPFARQFELASARKLFKKLALLAGFVGQSWLSKGQQHWISGMPPSTTGPVANWVPHRDLQFCKIFRPKWCTTNLHTTAAIPHWNLHKCTQRSPFPFLSLDIGIDVSFLG